MIVVMASVPRRSPLALAVLALLWEEPMHPYRIQQLIRERGKDEVVNVRQRASVYQAIDRLERDKLIEAAGTSRDENWPERTIYQLTSTGRRAVISWLREMLAAPAPGYPEFPAALAFLPLLEPADAALQLQARAIGVQREITRIQDADASAAAIGLPRVVLIEDEYRLALLRTELTWIQAVTDDLRAGRLTWTLEGLRSIAARAGAGTLASSQPPRAGPASPDTPGHSARDGATPQP
jgi:DNA-binding PadR family transcriptional regulator